MQPSRVFGLAAVLLSGVCAGTIDSRNGSATVTPAPRRNVRRERCFLVTNIKWTPPCDFPLLEKEGWREAPGWSVRPKRFAGLTTPSAPSAHPPLLCEEGNTLYQLMGFTKCLLTTGSAGFEPSSGSSMKIVCLLPISKL